MVLICLSPENGYFTGKYIIAILTQLEVSLFIVTETSLLMIALILQVSPN
jgi:hypothetical protein